MTILLIALMVGLLLVLNANRIELNEDFGYVQVRPGAHMFWWLYRHKDWMHKPLILWLQGGPGAGSSGYGNIYEMGPLDIHLKPKNFTWLDQASLLFLDQPVGSGYSYVDWKGALTRTNADISADLVTFSKFFFKAFPLFQNTPLYIFGESYGGKMVTRYALDLHQAVNKGQLKSNLKGVALFDSWIAPVDYVLSWAPYLYSFSLIDENSYSKIQKEALECKRLVDNGQYIQATNQWNRTQRVVKQHTNNISFYNVLIDDPTKELSTPEVLSNHPAFASLYQRNVVTSLDSLLQSVMNGYLKTKLNIPFHVSWGSQTDSVFSAQNGDFMKPVINEGTNMWMQKLKWPGFKAFNAANRVAISVPSDRIAGFVKTYGKLSYYYILKAGHMVPHDAPEASYKMLDMILNRKHKTQYPNLVC